MAAEACQFPIPAVFSRPLHATQSSGAGSRTATVRSMHAEGVRTVFLQIACNSHGSIVRKRALNRFIETAHRLKMHVVVWYLPTSCRRATGRWLPG